MQVADILVPVKNFYVSEEPRDVSSYSIKVEGNVNNRETLSLVNTMASLYSPAKYRISNLNIKNKNLAQFKKPSKLYWDIIFTKRDAKFYISMDQCDEDSIMNKAKTTWNRCKFSKLEITDHDLKKIDMKTDPEKCTACEMVLKTYNYKSLNTDLSNQYPLTNMIGITKALKDDEFVRVNIAIEPISRLSWISQAKDEIKAYNQGKIINNEIGLKEQMIKLGIDSLQSITDIFLEYQMTLIECILGIFFIDDVSISEDISAKSKNRNGVLAKSSSKAKKFELINEDDDIIERAYSGRSSSNYKTTAATFKTKITIISQSENIDRARVNMLAVGGAYKDLTNDNELVMRVYGDSEVKKSIKEMKNNEVNIGKKCILSDKEICKMIQLPQKGLQDEYKMDVIDTREMDVPKELMGGNIRICEVEEPSKSRKVVATFPQSINLLARKTVLLGGENSGKTTQLTRISKDFYKTGISNFVIDHQENGKLTNEISSKIPTGDKIIYDVHNEMPALAFTEVSKLITEDMDAMLRLDYANMIAQQVILFVNSITDEETGRLTGRMKRFLHSASMVTFIRPRATINDVFDVLRSYKKRNEALRYARYSKLFDEDDDIFTDLEELHKREDKGKIVGTREDLITGIVNRINVLKQNPKIKAMLKKEYDEKDDIDKYIQSGKSVFVKIPQNKFPDDDTRDMLAVFYFSRLWLTVQIRDENKDSRLCHVVLDEIKALPTLAAFMEKHITEFRRHRLALTISAHGLAQFGKLLKQLKDSGANFIILTPTEKNNIELLKEEIAPFTIEEALNLKPHHGLCVINYGNRYAKFIGRMFEN